MINLLHGDCLELMKSIPDKSVDMVLCDPPYGTTACKWDNIIPFDPMWNELKRITKDVGAICLFGSEPFSSHLRLSNLKMFKYDWVWKKSRAANFLNLKTSPSKKHEIISVFGGNKYFPEMIPMDEVQIRKQGNYKSKEKVADLYGNTRLFRGEKRTHTFPSSILEFQSVSTRYKTEYAGHPTQKPVALLEYLIKTYTLENETVLDFTMGSGSTGVACVNLNRKFIGIEKDDKYFKIAQDRIEDAWWAK